MSIEDMFKNSSQILDQWEVQEAEQGREFGLANLFNKNVKNLGIKNIMRLPNTPPTSRNLWM